MYVDYNVAMSTGANVYYDPYEVEINADPYPDVRAPP